MKLPIRKRILIVADGPSAEVLRDKPVPQTIYVIGVNCASVWLPRCDAYMTCFPDHRQRFLLNNKRKGVRYFAAAPPGYGSAFTADSEQHGPRERDVTFFTRVDGPGVQRDANACAGGNSAMAALDLANKMQAERVAIVGLDGDDAVRVSGGRPGYATDLRELFGAYDGSATVVSGSVHSRIDVFPRMFTQNAIDWLL